MAHVWCGKAGLEARKPCCAPSRFLGRYETALPVSCRILGSERVAAVAWDDALVVGGLIPFDVRGRHSSQKKSKAQGSNLKIGRMLRCARHVTKRLPHCLRSRWNFHGRSRRRSLEGDLIPTWMQGCDTGIKACYVHRQPCMGGRPRTAARGVK